MKIKNCFVYLNVKNDLLRTFLTIFVIYGIIIWISSWALRYLFFEVFHVWTYSEDKTYRLIKTLGLYLSSFYIVFQIIFLKLRSLRWQLIIYKLFFSLVGLVSLVILILEKPTAEKLDIIFLFTLGLLSGFLSYSTINKFDIKGFFGISFAWFWIIFINEMIIQRFIFIGDRLGEIRDIGNNMLAILIGLLLSIRYFWRK